MTLYEDVKSGRLTEQSLKQYISQNPNLINQTDMNDGLTPLALAVSKGNATIVRLLIENKADPEALSIGGRTALWIAADEAPKDRALIIDTLIKAGMNTTEKVDATDNDLDNETALMRVIRQFRDAEAVKLLIDAGADKHHLNNDKETPASLAMKMDIAAIDEALRPASERSKMLSEIITLIGAVVAFALAWAANHPLVKAVIQGVASEIHTITSTQAATVIKKIHIPPPATPAEFKASVQDFIKAERLHKFFKPGDPFLESLVNNAVKLQADPNSFFNTPQRLKDLTTLSVYQPVIYCDDSGSMTGARAAAQGELVQRITDICTLLVPEHLGVHLRFINADLPGLNNVRTNEVKQIVETLQPDGWTEIGTNLRKKILQPFVYDKIDKRLPFERPLLISIITDGTPGGDEDTPETEDTLKEAILECSNKLVNCGYAPESVMFQISQVGADDGAKMFLEKLRGDPRLKYNLYCTADQLDDKFKELRKNEKYLHIWLLKTLRSAISKKKA